MILRQLIQAGRRFCECRHQSFIPADERQVVLLAYTIQDKLEASSFDLDDDGIDQRLIDWLLDLEAVAYLYIERHNHQHQAEFPHPLGRLPMDRLTHTAATKKEVEMLTYFVEQKPQLDACRLHLAKQVSSRSSEGRKNLLSRSQLAKFCETENLFFEFAS